MVTAFTLLIVMAYAYVGYKLNKNFILWGLLGFGILVGPTILMIIVINILDAIFLSPLIISITILGSFLFSIIFSWLTVHENKASFTKNPDQLS